MGRNPDFRIVGSNPLSSASKSLMLESGLRRVRRNVGLGFRDQHSVVKRQGGNPSASQMSNTKSH
jgi:hypothetical protein